jgi:hypothetical protein
VSQIDFTDVGGLAALPLNVELNARVERATAAAARLPRDYLGASIAGDECARAIQYAWWCTPDLPARVQLIFDRGHAFEALIKAQLVRAGFAFAPPEALEFVALDGHLKGHADGIIIAGPALPGVYLAFPCVFECKALNAKNWRAVNKDGFVKTFPRYATQVALYQHFLDKTSPALITCVNSDTCEVLHLALPFDAVRARGAVERAEAIVAATRNGELLPRFTNDHNNWSAGFASTRAAAGGRHEQQQRRTPRRRREHQMPRLRRAPVRQRVGAAARA